MGTRKFYIVITILILLFSKFQAAADTLDDSTKTGYPHPFLTLHLGVSYGTNNGDVRLNSGQSPGTLINIPKDLNYPDYKIFPRVNAILNFGNFHGVAFDTYHVMRREEDPLPKDIRFGNKFFQAGNMVKSKMTLNYVSLSYIDFFRDNGRSRLGYLVGVTGIFYSIKMTNTAIPGYTESKSFGIPLPTIGLNGSIYVTRNLFLRGVIKYSAWWSKNYNCNVIDFNPYFEYYIHKNIGVGMRYHLGYTSLKDLPNAKFNGSIKNTFSAVSLVFVWRFLKK